MPLPMMTTSAVFTKAKVRRKKEKVKGGRLSENSRKSERSEDRRRELPTSFGALKRREPQLSPIIGFLTHSLTRVVLTIFYAGAGVPPVIGGRIGLSGLVEGSFTAGSSCCTPDSVD